MNELRISVQSVDSFFASALEMARELDQAIVTNEPAMFSFEAMEQFLKVLTPNRWRLLHALKRSDSSSIRALALSLGRDYRGVYADISMLLGAGLVKRADDGKVFVPWSRIIAELDAEMAA